MLFIITWKVGLSIMEREDFKNDVDDSDTCDDELILALSSHSRGGRFCFVITPVYEVYFSK